MLLRHSLISLFDALYGMFQFADDEIQFQRRFRFRRFQIRHNDVSEKLAELLHLRLLPVRTVFPVQFDKFVFNSRTAAKVSMMAKVAAVAIGLLRIVANI